MQQPSPPAYGGWLGLLLHHKLWSARSGYHVLIQTGMLECRGVCGQRERNVPLKKDRLYEKAQELSIVSVVGLPVLLAIPIDQYVTNRAAVFMIFDRR